MYANALYAYTREVGCGYYVFIHGTGGNNVSYATCHLRIHMSRRPYYYIRNILVPIMLTTTLAFTAFFYEIEQLEERYVD